MKTRINRKNLKICETTKKMKSRDFLLVYRMMARGYFKAKLASATVRWQSQWRRLTTMTMRMTTTSRMTRMTKTKDNKDDEEELFFAKMVKTTKYTSLPNLMRQGQCE